MTIQKVTTAEAETLLNFIKKTFYDFYGHLNTAENMQAYSALHFTMDNTLAQLNNPGSEFYFALIDDEIAGYLKINFDDAQTDIKDKNALEVERIYVSKQHHGKYIGKQLLNFALDKAAAKSYSYVWLGVWDKNDLALAFYKRNGFEIFGSHDFWLGNDKQVDLMMKRIL
jgi:ribosomal protein S18 acetylase RimI-like enzyme